MTDSEILNLFIPFVDFLGQVLGENTEVVLHDVSCPEHSVVAIRHGFHSGRTVGSSLTDFAFRVKNNKEYENHDYLINYRAKAKCRCVMKQLKMEQVSFSCLFHY